MTSWQEELDSYEATFSEDAPMSEKLAHLDRLAVGSTLSAPPLKHYATIRRLIGRVLIAAAIIGVLWTLLVLGGVE